MKFINKYLDNLNQSNILWFMCLLAIIYYFKVFSTKKYKKEHFNEKVIDFSKNDYEKYVSKKNPNEQQILNDLNKKGNQVFRDENLKNINEIIKKTTSTLVDILNDIVNIKQDQSEEINYMESYLYYFKNIITIIFKNGRLFYVGICMIFLAILVSFIDISK